MGELQGNENCHAEKAFQEVEIQLHFHGVWRPDKHFGLNAQPSCTYVFTNFILQSYQQDVTFTSYYGHKVHGSSF